MTLLAIWSVSAVVSLPGLAISPIMGVLTRIFPKVSDLEIQMLASLPSLLIIPFVLLSGRLSVNRNKLGILLAGLAIFFVSGALFFFAKSMTALIVLSCILGIGAGMVIPLSTGLVADYFSGPYRTRQLGLSSAINNMTLVLATFLAGYLARFGWHFPFIVYLVPGISIVLCSFLKRDRPAPMPQKAAGKPTAAERKTFRGKMAALMALYFFATYSVLAVDFYLPFLLETYHLRASVAGTLISLFFLAIMVPGFFLNGILRTLRNLVSFWSLFMMAAGLAIVVASHYIWLMAAGCLVAGFGYGILQPLIYEKTADIAPPRVATYALSLVMSVNYLAILICPFIIDLLRKAFGAHNTDVFPFVLNAILTGVTVVLAFLRRGRFVYGLDPKYFAPTRTAERKTA